MIQYKGNVTFFNQDLEWIRWKKKKVWLLHVNFI